MKLVRRLILGVILLVLVGVGVLIFSLDGIVRRTIASQSTEQLKLQTTLTSASLSLVGGKVSLSDLEIASPAGFQAPKMFTVGGVAVGVSYGQLRSNPIHVGSIVIDKPMMVCERGPDGTFNFKKATDDMPKSESSSTMKLIIDELTIKDASVKMRPGLPGLPAEIPINVPTFTMKNVGNSDGASNGAAMKDVVMQIISAMVAHAGASDGLGAQFKGMLNTNIAGTLTQLGGDAQKQVLSVLPGDLGKSLSGAVPDAGKLLNDPGKALQGLLGGSKPPENK